MMDFNQAIVLGNVTKDLELRNIPSGQAVVSFSVATNRRWTNKESGQQQESTEFHNVVAWGKLAEICNQILYKGRKVLVVGRLQTRNWQGQDGVKRYTTEIVADHVSATGASKSSGETQISDSGYNKTNTANQNENKSSNLAQNEPKKQDTKNEEINLDDIPF